MKQLGFGSGYRYDHDEENSFSGQNYFPDGMERQNFFSPKELGYERELKRRIDYFCKLRESKKHS